jgi:hypothetical protein
MISTAIARRLGPVFVGLYLVAQICGVIPLMICDSAHAAPGTQMLSNQTRGLQDHHHAGDADDADHHHVLQDLNGVLLQSYVSVGTIVRIAIEMIAPRALADADAVLLERPPKPFLSV